MTILLLFIYGLLEPGLLAHPLELEPGIAAHTNAGRLSCSHCLFDRLQNIHKYLKKKAKIMEVLSVSRGTVSQDYPFFALL